MQRGWEGDCLFRHIHSPELWVRGRLIVGYRLKSCFEVCTSPGRFSLTEMNILTHLYFQPYLIKDTEPKWSKGAMGTRADTASLGSAFTLASGIFTKQRFMWLSVQQASCQTWKEKKRENKICTLLFRGLFTIIEPFCFLNQLSMDNTNRKRWNGDQSRVRITISLKGVSASYFLLT